MNHNKLSPGDIPLDIECINLTLGSDDEIEARVLPLPAINVAADTLGELISAAAHDGNDEWLFCNDDLS